MGSSEVEVGIVCHLANGPEDRVYRDGALNSRHSTPVFVVVRMALLVARLAFVC